MSGIMMALAGCGGGAVQLAIPNITDLAVDPADATASLSFDTDGDGSYLDTSGTTNFNWWTLAPQVGIGASYWIRLTVNSGTAPTGSPTGSWLQLNSARSWSLTRTTIGVTTGNYTIAIASDAAGANIVASDSVVMTADVES